MKKTIAPTQSYSGDNGDNFVRITLAALDIAAAERAAGRAEPQHGYSRGDWLRAEEMIKNSIR